MAEGRVYVILLNFNGWADTIECLESVLRSEGVMLTAVVCDNASSDGSFEKIRNWASGRQAAPVPPESPLAHLTTPPLAKPIAHVELDRASAERGEGNEAPLVLIRTGANLGYAGGNNVGLRYALARPDMRHAWVLNNDTVIAPDTLARAVSALEAEPNAGLCGSTLRYYEEPERIQMQGGGVLHPLVGQTHNLGANLPLGEARPAEEITPKLDYISGAAALASRRFLETVGLMHEGYFLYYEEADWGVRARKAGLRLTYAPDSTVFHKHGATIGVHARRRERSPVAEYYIAKNRLRFTARHFPWALPLAWLFLALTLLNRLRRRQWSRAAIIARVLLGGSRTIDDLLARAG